MKKRFGVFFVSFVFLFCIGCSNNNADVPRTRDGEISAGNSINVSQDMKESSPQNVAEDNKNRKEDDGNNANTSNEKKDTEKVHSGRVIFSKENSFYSDAIDVELSFDSEKKAKIYYTLDGSEPTSESKEYNASIHFESTDGVSPNVYILKAAAIATDGTCSLTTAHTYFVGKKVKERYSTMIVSLIADPADLYESPYGIFTEELITSNLADREREVYIEAIDSEGDIIFEQNGGVRVVGGESRTNCPYPSLKLYARKKYTPDKGYFPFDGFESERYDKPGKTVKKYGKLVLRSSGDDNQQSMVRDVLCADLAKQAGFENYEAGIPALTYLNGEYYGLMWLRESYCDEYFRRKYGEWEGEYVVIEETEQAKHQQAGASELERKAVKEFNTFYKKYATADLTNDKTYKEVCAFMDVEDYLRYYAFELYVGNSDWPQNNFFCYRYYANDDITYGDGTHDGRWRFIMHDMDITLGIYNDKLADRNTWKEVMDPSSERYAPLFAALMKRDDCRQYFVQYTYGLSNGVLSYQNIKDTLNRLDSERKGELSFQYEYMKKAYANKNLEYFTNEGRHQTNLDKILTYAKERKSYADKYVKELFSVK